jgi:hypothetical protein
MSKLVLTNAYVRLDGIYDISDYISSISLATTHETIETTEMNNVYRTLIAGLGQNSVSFEFYQDFDDNGLEEIINGTSLANSKVGTPVTIEVLPKSSVVSANNPKYTFTAIITDWQPLSSAIGEITTVNVTWPISGEITKTIT